MKLRITIAGNTYEAEVELLEDEEAPALHAPIYVSAASEAMSGGAEAVGGAEAADGVCRSPVTGVVIRVDVEAGQAVDSGQLLMVLESMKMETQIVAPHAGMVEKVLVAAGNSVKASQVLVELA